MGQVPRGVDGSSAGGPAPPRPALARRGCISRLDACTHAQMQAEDHKVCVLTRSTLRAVSNLPELDRCTPLLQSSSVEMRIPDLDIAGTALLLVHQRIRYKSILSCAC